MRLNFKEIKKELIRQNWRIEMTEKSHWKFIPPDKNNKIVIASGTPSCPFAVKNMLGDLKRNGFID